MSNYIYQIRNLKHFYNTKPALEIGELSVPKGSITGLMGPNGSGKSTLLKLMGFIERPTRGEILFKSKPAEPFSDAVRFRVTLLTQIPYLMKRSVLKNIAYGLQLRGDRNNHRSRIYEALNMVGLPPEVFANRQWYELSGGEAQRVALAARMVLRPEVLLLDEPTASVDAASVQLIREASVRARREWGTTLIVASHDWQWLYEVCDEVLYLFRGRLSGSGNESVLFGPWHPRSDGFWEKKLDDGQCIVVSEPPEKDAAAVITPDHIAAGLPGDKSPSRGTRLDGVISRLILEKRTGRIITTILVGNFPLTAKFDQSRIRELKLYPGCEVRLYYDPGSVKWL
ncbi:ATP-binding cassette domain-containing protein [Desulfococcaceae bacterium HSG8]|nr:ATP-binding cassette domain-containing protein [Desulfococcaceae bacterium HSG8]